MENRKNPVGQNDSSISHSSAPFQSERLPSRSLISPLHLLDKKMKISSDFFTSLDPKDIYFFLWSIHHQKINILHQQYMVIKEIQFGNRWGCIWWMIGDVLKQIILQQVWMEQSKSNYEYLQQLPKANPIQKKTAVSPRSISPLLPLPSFRFSEECFDLAPIFSSAEAKQQHTLKQNSLRKLFQNPIYQANSKYVTTANNLKYACLKAYYLQSGLHPPPQQIQNGSQLCFESRFESGNLAFVAKSQIQNEYYLLLQKDINTTRCTQWFFFRVHNNKYVGKVRFHILNLLKSYSSFENGMKVSVCRQSNDYTWERDCEEIKYLKNNIKTGGEKTYHTLSFGYTFQQEADVIYFAHSPPYTFSMLDRHLLAITNDPHFNSIFKRKTLTESPGGNYVEMITITNFKSVREKRVAFITSRVHPGETPSSFVCEGLINFLISSSEEAKKLRECFIFKIVPMLNPDGVINGSYRCSLSGYDLNRVWHYDSKISSPEIYYTKRAILQLKNCFLFIDLHAHSKKKGVFMYGCQNRASPYISRHIPYLFWKEIECFNYYQCNFGMRLGREGTSRLTVHHLLNLPYSYTMEHSFCSSTKHKSHFSAANYAEIGKGIGLTLRKYFCSKEESPEIFRELWTNKQLMKVGCTEDGSSSDDSELDEPVAFKELLESNRTYRRKASSNIRSKLMLDFSSISPSKLRPRKALRETSPRKLEVTQQVLPSFFERAPDNEMTKKLLRPTLAQFQPMQEQQLKMEEFLSSRLQEKGDQSPEKDPQIVVLKSSSRYQFDQLQGLSNLFLPSLTSASYKRYAKKKNYNKQLMQVGRRYLEAKGLLKQEIRSVSKKKPGWKEQILSYI